MRGQYGMLSFFTFFFLSNHSLLPVERLWLPWRWTTITTTITSTRPTTTTMTMAITATGTSTSPYSMMIRTRAPSRYGFCCLLFYFTNSYIERLRWTTNTTSLTTSNTTSTVLPTTTTGTQLRRPTPPFTTNFHVSHLPQDDESMTMTGLESRDRHGDLDMDSRYSFIFFFTFTNIPPGDDCLLLFINSTIGHVPTVTVSRFPSRSLLLPSPLFQLPVAPRPSLCHQSWLLYIYIDRISHCSSYNSMMCCTILQVVRKKEFKLNLTWFPSPCNAMPVTAAPFPRRRQTMLGSSKSLVRSSKKSMKNHEVE